MARYCGNKDPEALLDAAQTWLKQCLQQGQSVFSDRVLWTLSNFQTLETHFSNNLDEGEGDFFDKLETQLSECKPEVKQLAAELMWLMLLCPSNISAGKKRQSVLRIWAWSGEELDETLPSLSDDTLKGVGSGGTSYNTNRWREL
ncbi:MAG: hypothetical protein WD601_02385, partial [Pseudohongiellaceae bacterium]